MLNVRDLAQDNQELHNISFVNMSSVTSYRKVRIQLEFLKKIQIGPSKNNGKVENTIECVLSIKGIILSYIRNAFVSN